MKVGNVGGIQNLYSPSSILRSKPASFEIKEASSSIKDRVISGIDQVDQKQRIADLKLENLASGKEVDIHGTMIALQEADITLRFAVSIRDKLLEGYQKIISMSI